MDQSKSHQSNSRVKQSSGPIKRPASAPTANPRSPRRGSMDEVLIAVMGATGTGKSTFTNLASGASFGVNHGLRSMTRVVQTSNSFELNGRLVTLIDTPGFDDTEMSDTEVLSKIGVYLETTYRAKQKLSGLIYMYNITETRLKGISVRNFTMFKKLCGENSLKNVLIVTTMWGELRDKARGQQREEELKTDAELGFKEALRKGAKMKRHDNTAQSARSILEHFLKKKPRTLQIQQELVDKKWDISQTSAGAELDQHLATLAADYKRKLDDLEEKMKQALRDKDEEMKKTLKEDRKRFEEKLKKTTEDREQMSRVYQQMQAKAMRRLRDLQEKIEQEKKERKEGQKRIDKLQSDLKRSQSRSRAEKEKMEKELTQLRKKYQKRDNIGMFARIGQAIGSLFSSSDD